VGDGNFAWPVESGSCLDLKHAFSMTMAGRPDQEFG
jgi:hypothetical protein